MTGRTTHSSLRWATRTGDRSRICGTGVCSSGDGTGPASGTRISGPFRSSNATTTSGQRRSAKRRGRALAKRVGSHSRSRTNSASSVSRYGRNRRSRGGTAASRSCRASTRPASSRRSSGTTTSRRTWSRPTSGGTSRASASRGTTGSSNLYVDRIRVRVCYSGGRPANCTGVAGRS